MAHELKLTKGTRSLTISSGRYALGADFVPPTTQWSLNMSGSTSANRHGGASVMSKRAINTEFVFTVYVSGTSSTEVNRGVTDLAGFIDLAGDEYEPLYLEWRENSDLPVPIWGQFGAPLRLEVVSGSVGRDELYGVATLRKVEAAVMVYLTVKPFWKGTIQRLLQAADAVREDRGRWYTDGTSRGLMIGEVMVNHFTNPVFGNITDPDNGWTAATVKAEINNDLKYIAFHDSSMKLIAADGAGKFYQALDVNSTAAYMISCYAKLPDSGVISATQCKLYYGTGVTSTYTAKGNGWYRLNGAVTGVDANKSSGIRVESGYTVYTDGFQLEATRLRHFTYGDLPGNIWNSTAHASTTTQSEGFARLNTDDWAQGRDRYSAGVGYLGEFSAAIVWKTDVANTFATDMYLLDIGAVNFYFKASDDKFYLEDGTNTASSAAQTFAIGDILHLVIVCKPGEIRIYKNGTSIANAAAYDPPDPGFMYVGSNSAPDYQIQGTIMGLTLYDTGLTQAQVTAIYTAASPLITDGERVDWLPWQQTLAGDNLTDGYYTAADQDWQVIDGIPGNIPADSLILAYATTSHAAGAILGLNACDEYMNMTDGFLDCNGTGYVQALSSQTETSAAFTTSETAIPATKITITYPPQNYQGKQAYLAAVLADNGTGLQAYFRAATSVNISSDWQSLAADTTLRFFLIGPLTLPMIASQLDRTYGPIPVIMSIVCKRSGTSATVNLDYYRLLVGKVAYVPTSLFILNGHKAWNAYAGAAYISASKPTIVRGDPIEFEPNKINYLITIPYGIAMEATAADAAMETDIQVIPRWGIL